MKYLIYLVLLLATYSCIGTDYTDEALILNESSIKIFPENFNITIGQSLNFTSEITNIKGEIITSPIQWISTQPNVATISESGKLEALSEGNTIIIATYQDELNTHQKDSSFIKVVSDGSPDNIGGITITSEISNLTPGTSAQFSAIVRSTTGSTLNIPLIWKSSKPEYATIDSQGKVTAKAIGETVITAEAEGVVSNSFILKVNDPQGLTGSFVGKTGHRVSGNVSISSDNSTLTLQEDFNTQAGPGLQIYLSKSADSGTGGIDLGAIKSNKGKQTYTIPTSVKVSDYKFVLVYCKPFNVVFGAAELK